MSHMPVEKLTPEELEAVQARVRGAEMDAGMTSAAMLGLVFDTVKNTNKPGEEPNDVSTD